MLAVVSDNQDRRTMSQTLCRPCRSIDTRSDTGTARREKPEEVHSVRPKKAAGHVPPSLSVVVPTRNRPDMLDSALASLEAALGTEDELIVADSASTDVRIGEIASRHGARYVRCALPGTSRARNAGAASSSGDLIAFVDDDCLVAPAWATAIREAFAANADVGFLAGAVLPIWPAGGVGGLAKRSAERLCVSVNTDTVRLCVGPIEVSGSPGKSARTRADLEQFAHAAHGANMAWRRGLLEELGGFDEQMGPGTSLLAAEDKDAFYRALIAGARGLLEPAALAYHLQWRTLGEQLHAYFAYGVGDAALERKLSMMARCRSKRHAAPSVRLGSLISRCAKDALGALASGYESGFLAECAKLGGALAGSLSSLGFGIEAGHFVEGKATRGPWAWWHAR